MRLSLPTLCLAGILLGLAAAPSVAQETVLFNFPAGGNDGYLPYGAVTVSGSTLYGMASGGGSSNKGVVFSLNTNGTGYTMLHQFNGADGRAPYGSLTISGSTIYGMTQLGGSNDLGGIFRMNTNGTGFSLLRSFAADSEGSQPYGSLALSGSTLYGTTFSDGPDFGGTLFKMNTDGTGHTVLHYFAPGAGNGMNPRGSPILSGGKLYGTTQLGGSTPNAGTVYSVNADGTGFTTLHEFSFAEAYSPHGPLTLVGSTLYGMTYSGGAGFAGTIFSMETDGSDYSIIHEFVGGAGDGASPEGGLTQVGSQLYGMARSGNSGKGTFFTFNLDGTGYTTLVAFDGPTTGATPFGDLVADGTTLYGMTSAGGTFGNGVIFSYATPIPEPSTYALLAGLGGLGLALHRRRRRIITP